MDLSALIFVALAVAWAVYLIPKALRHHEEDAVHRSVESFSDRVRVLARREAVSADRAELVLSAATRRGVLAVAASDGGAPPAAAASGEAPGTPARRRAHREAAARAARRRRRVLALLLLANAVAIALAATAVILWPYVAVPAGLLVAWLVACRLMVRRERAARSAAMVREATPRTARADEAAAVEPAAADAVAPDPGADATDQIPAGQIPAAVAEVAPGDGWDPVPVTLPTYVAKASAGRTVRTIDLDATGVWSSGRSAADSELARHADEAAKVGAPTEEQRATGS